MVARHNAIGTDVVLVHTSDLHLSTYDDVPTNLVPVLSVADKVGAGALLLAGDIFDNNRVPDAVLRAVRERLEAIAAHVVILPGNHDALSSSSCYERGFVGSSSITVLGMASDRVCVPEADLQVWGVPHVGDATTYVVPPPPLRTSAWQVAMLHGHYTEKAEERYSWPIRPADLERTRADYVALGHWDHVAHVTVKPPAWYSGAPHHADSVNVIRLSARHGVSVASFPVEGRAVESLSGIENK